MQYPQPRQKISSSPTLPSRFVSSSSESCRIAPPEPEPAAATAPCRRGASVERRLLPSVALQGAVGTLGGFLGFFVVGAIDLVGMIEFTAVMLTVAMLSTVLAYALAPRLRLSGRRLFKLGFMLPGLLLLFGGGELISLAAAYGLFIGLTYSARSWLEMSLLEDAQRDSYAVRAGTSSIALSLVATFVATLVLSIYDNESGSLYIVYGIACLFGGFFAGKRLPNTPPVALKAPLAVLRHRSFINCFPLFFLQAGLFGVGLALSASGAAQSLKGASNFGLVASVAAVVGGVALWGSRNFRTPANRTTWMAVACVGVMAAFTLLGASAWIPKLFIAYLVLQSAAGPFWAASEQVLNQRTLDLDAELPDLIVARESAMWVFRMLALGLLWLFCHKLPVTLMLLYGAGSMAVAVALQFMIARSWMRAGGGRSQTALVV